MSTPRLDHIAPGTLIRVDEGGHESIVMLKSRDGEGNDRRITFVGKSYDGSLFEYEVYRFNGRWAFGSSAGSVKVLEVTAAL